MSANHGYSKGKLEKALQHAATAPMPSLAGKQAVSQDVADPMEEDDGQEVAADNQVELQQHEESMDESDADQPEEAKSGAVVAGSPVLSAPVAEKLDEGIDHIIKVRVIPIWHEHHVCRSLICVIACMSSKSSCALCSSSFQVKASKGSSRPAKLTLCVFSDHAKACAGTMRTFKLPTDCLDRGALLDCWS